MIEEVQEITSDLVLDKSSWTKVKFGDVAIQMKGNVDRENTELTWYIKGEHMGSDDLHIREWGELKDEYLGPAFHRKFVKGNILYGSRRTYLRKVAIAHFDGITSNTTFVISPQTEIMHPDLLPFVMMSEGFTQHSIKNSKGSVNPYINWKDIASYEFLLPPKDQQDQLTELLWAMDEMIEKELKSLDVLRNTLQIYFENRVQEMKGVMTPLSNVLIPKKNKSTIPHEQKKYIGLEHIEPGAFRCKNYMESSSVKAQCNLIDKGDLCYSKLRPYLDKAFIAEFEAVSTTELLVYDTKLVSSDYVLYHLHSKPFINYVSGQGFGTKMPRVSHKIIGEYPIKILENQDKLLNELEKFSKCNNQLQSKISSSKDLQKSLINQIV